MYTQPVDTAALPVVTAALLAVTAAMLAVAAQGLVLVDDSVSAEQNMHSSVSLPKTDFITT